MIIDSKNSIIDNINSHVKTGHKNGMFSSSIITNEILEEAGHVIIRLKFYKFATEADESKSQREIEIVRTFSFVDIEGFSSDFIDLVESNKVVTAKNNPKNYSMFCFKRFIESIANRDLIKFSEISSTLTDVLTEIFTIQNLFTFIFGFVSEYKQDLVKSKLTLDILNKCKLINNSVFYLYLQKMDISVSQLGNIATKEEFQILDLIFSELLFFIEKTFRPLDSFYKDIKDMDQQNKFHYLKSWLKRNKFPFDTHKAIIEILEYVFTYFKTRARWKCLLKAKNDILKLTERLNNTSEIIKNDLINKFNNNNNVSAISSGSSINIKDISFSNIINNSKDLFENEISLSMNNEVPKESSSNMENISNNFLQKTKNKALGITKRKSMETSFSQKIFKNLQKSIKETFKGIYYRFTEEEKCISCGSVQKNKTPKISNEKLINEYKTLRVLQTKIGQDQISAIAKEEHESLSEINSEDIKLHLHFNNSNIVLNKKQTSEKDIAQRISQLNNKIDEFKQKQNSINKENTDLKATIQNFNSFQS